MLIILCNYQDKNNWLSQVKKQTSDFDSGEQHSSRSREEVGLLWNKMENRMGEPLAVYCIQVEWGALVNPTVWLILTEWFSFKNLLFLILRIACLL